MNFNDISRLINQTAKIFNNINGRSPYGAFHPPYAVPRPGIGQQRMAPAETLAQRPITYYINRIKDFLYREV